MLPTTEPGIDLFLHAFETCTLPKSEWTHAAHIFTGACYVHTHGLDLAIDTMRTNVRRYNVSVGGLNTDTSGYHETITLAWLKLIHRLLKASQPIARAPFAAHAVAHYVPQRDIFSRHYSFDLPTNTPSRLAWIEPDLEPLDESQTLDESQPLN
jgi:hypothetical protein